MPRTPRGQIDLLATYTFIDPADPPDPPELDYYVTEDDKYTIWGVGLITFGSPTQAQTGLDRQSGQPFQPFRSVDISHRLCGVRLSLPS